MKYDYDPIPLDYPLAPELDEMLARARDYVELISRRRSVRHFSDKPVPREVIEACLQAAGSAPSGAIISLGISSVLATLISSVRLELPQRKRRKHFTVGLRAISGSMIYTDLERIRKNPF